MNARTDTHDKEKPAVQAARARPTALESWRNRARGLVSLALLGGLAAGLVWLARFDERAGAVHELIRSEKGEPSSDGIYVGRVRRAGQPPEFTVIFSRVPLVFDLERSRIRILEGRSVTVPAGVRLLLVDAEGHVRPHRPRLGRGHELVLAALLARGTSFEGIRELYGRVDPDLQAFWADGP